MFGSRSAIYIFLAFALVLALALALGAFSATAASNKLPTSPDIDKLDPTVTLWAASGSSITFKTQNGRTTRDVLPQTTDIPHLVLYRNGALTEAEERTLIVQVADIEVPPAGAIVTLEVETQHGNPDRGIGSGERILVRHETRRITNSQGITQTSAVARFALEFTELVASARDAVATPTDYYRYQVTVLNSEHSEVDPIFKSEVNYAFLMESQWIEALPEVSEASNGAAPDELIVFYCDVFPFRAKEQQLERSEVLTYIKTDLAPAMARAFKTQSDEWQMGRWYREWTSFRGEERLSVALAMPGTWFHGRALNHSGISLLTFDDNPSGFQYERLIDEQMSSFDHELFHNLQMNLSLHAGSAGFSEWRFFTEGQAVMVASIANPELEFYHKANYISRANQFLRSGLNKSYASLDPYQAAVYWRFLYENCGGFDAASVEHPEIGLRIIKRALMALYAEPRTNDDIVAKMQEVMDGALRESSCPFATHQESLIAFARAGYALHISGEGCQIEARPSGCPYYDPQNLYGAPYVTALDYHTAAQPYQGVIQSSFGIDYVEIALDGEAGLADSPLSLEFYGVHGAGAEFDVWLVILVDSGMEAQSFRTSARIVNADISHIKGADGHQSFFIPVNRSHHTDKLGLVITRTDNNETTDPVGRYTLTLRRRANSQR